MKVLDIPQSGKRGLLVGYRGRFGLVHRQYVVPANPRTPSQRRRRQEFGHIAPAWSDVLTQAQRDVWNLAGAQVQSKRRLESGPLTGQQLFQGLNSARACIGQTGILLVPTARPVFELSPVAGLTIAAGESGARLLLQVTGPVREDIMVFGQAPCSAGRSKRRNVAYLGLLPAPQDGLSDITDLYIARFGAPRAGEKVFIVTCQQKDGWEGDEHVTSDIVPGNPAGQQAPATGALTLIPLMHKGCTRDAHGTVAPPLPGSQAGATPEILRGEAAATELGGEETRITPIPTKDGRG